MCPKIWWDGWKIFRWWTKQGLKVNKKARLPSTVLSPSIQLTKDGNIWRESGEVLAHTIFVQRKRKLYPFGCEQNKETRRCRLQLAAIWTPVGEGVGFGPDRPWSISARATVRHRGHRRTGRQHRCGACACACRICGSSTRLHVRVRSYATHDASLLCGCVGASRPPAALEFVSLRGWFPYAAVQVSFCLACLIYTAKVHPYIWSDQWTEWAWHFQVLIHLSGADGCRTFIKPNVKPFSQSPRGWF